MKILKGKYEGLLDAERKKMLTGKWFQGSGSLPLDMKKTSEKVTTKEIKRPQTPKPIFKYAIKEVEYDNADKSVHFGATFTAPMPDPHVRYRVPPRYPTVILITGSGQQDRDETIFEHKPFAVIADYLTKNGIAVLRVDDRGIGKTTGEYGKSTSADFEKDVETSLNFLKTLKQVDTNKIGLIGHSEGGMIAPMVAVKRKEIKFLVLLAGPAVPIIDLMAQQSSDVMAASGIAKKDLDLYAPLYKRLVNAIVYEKDTATAFKKAITVFMGWQKQTPASTVIITTGVTDEKSRAGFVNDFVKQLSIPWYNYFMKVKPADYLSKLTCPVLALNGEKDIQVAAKPNLAAVSSILKKSGKSKFKTQELKGLNHLFQHCIKCTVDEYGELEETFSPEVLEIMGTWIKATVQ